MQNQPGAIPTNQQGGGKKNLENLIEGKTPRVPHEMGAG